MDDGQYRWLSNVMCRTLVQRFPRFDCMMAVGAAVIPLPVTPERRQPGYSRRQAWSAFSLIQFLVRTAMFSCGAPSINCGVECRP